MDVPATRSENTFKLPITAVKSCPAGLRREAVASKGLRVLVVFQGVATI